MINEKKSISLVGEEYRIKDVKPLSPEIYRDLVKRRALEILDISTSREGSRNDEVLRKEMEIAIVEKIDKENNLLPIDFLYTGIEKARAICRISTPAGYGTGFLINKGMIMTNYHVIENVETALNSFAEFYYEENKVTVMVSLKPNEIFITSSVEDLDFTIVGCEMTGIEDITPIYLSRNPSTITRGEYANIIQHPAARKKEVALQDNRVLYVYDKVIHYNTDTEPGSSGAAVFNNKWQLVALHHAGWSNQNNTTDAINEGIRISAIVSRLITQANKGDVQASNVIQSLEGTYPYLGFFDVYGLGSNYDVDAEIPYYKGNKSFADVGFWNLFNMNHFVDEEKIQNIAQMVFDVSMDVLGLTKVESAVLDRVIQLLKQKGANMDYIYLDAEGTQSLAVLYDLETTQVELRKDINDKYQFLLESRTPLGYPAFPKRNKPLFAKCTVKEEGKDIEFLFIVVHIKAFGDVESAARKKLAEDIMSVIIEDLQQHEEFKNLPIILGGDFNEQAEYSCYVENPKSLIDKIIVSNDANVEVRFNDSTDIVRIDKSVKNFVKEISDSVPALMRLIFKGKFNHLTERYPLSKNNSPTVNIVTDSDSLQRTLLTLQANQKRLENITSYYDEEKEKLLINEYYSNINFNIEDRKALYQNLNELLTNTHSRWLSYQKSKKELYSSVDLREDGKLKSIYSGKILDPEVLIREDTAVERAREQLYLELINNEKLLTDRKKEEIIDVVESQFNYNTEHVVPQSWFNKMSPMVGDLHHLFTCEAGCNQFRSDLAYFDFIDYVPEEVNEVMRNSCGKREKEQFEPEGGKGEAARAVLYFLLRYPNKIRSDRTNRIDINLLIQWHKSYPVTMHEKHRNRGIFNLQGNRNPLIDFPQCADLIDFTIGL